MNLKQVHNVYLIGIGGIGMSAVARYFNLYGKNVSGYDRSSSKLIFELIAEGIQVHFDDDVDKIPEIFKNEKDHTLVIYTPAIPGDHEELNYFMKNGFGIKKRAEVLGMLSASYKGLAIAGTHGKTTISTMTAYLLKNSEVDCSAFLGGIAKDFNTNYLFSPESPFIVLEADEYDRSFLHLDPFMAVISAMDIDHLDVYSGANEIKETFGAFIEKIQPGGKLIFKEGLPKDIIKRDDIEVYSYSLNQKSDFYASDFVCEHGKYVVNIHTPIGIIEQVKIGMHGFVNVENAVAAIALSTLTGVQKEEIQHFLPAFSGIRRRFDYQVDTPDMAYIDDYAHHPEELKAVINSVKKMYKGKKVTGVFQPHLYSRTKDLAKEFAGSLDLLDDIILTEIYPAREEPIEGVSSELIFKNIKNKNKVLCSKDEIVGLIGEKKPEVLLTLGAGDIDRYVEPIKKILLQKAGS